MIKLNIHFIVLKGGLKINFLKVILSISNEEFFNLNIEKMSYMLILPQLKVSKIPNLYTH